MNNQEQEPLNYRYFYRPGVEGVFAYDDDQLSKGLAEDAVELSEEDVRALTSPAAPTGAHVDAERDRRIAAGFTFGGVLYQTERQQDRESILGAQGSSLAAIIGGAQPGDLRWSDPGSDFFWIAEDNSRVPMDAQTTQAFALGAMSYKAKLVVAGSNLKAMDSIPADYTDDKWWP